MSIDAFRGQQFTDKPLRREALSENPFEQFENWYSEAELKVSGYANPVTLATCGDNGQPVARTVLLKGYDNRGFSFYTNYQSRKGRHMEENPRASLCLFWEELERQIIIIGSVVKMTAEESDAYFATRPRGSQIGAHVSKQSEQISGREQLETELKHLESQFEGQPVPRPEHWGGYRLIPESIEFWQGQPDRLHDRFIYQRNGNRWDINRLAP